MMKVFNVSKGKLKLEKEIELPEVVSVTTNQVDQIILGGKNKQVEIFKSSTLEQKDFESGFTAMKF
jgi:hypothetical protein